MKLLADIIAESGYTTLVPDIFNGDPIKPDEMDTVDIGKWITEGSDGRNPHTPEAMDPIVRAAIDTLRTEYGAQRIGAMGYCLGAKVTCSLSSLPSSPGGTA